MLLHNSTPYYITSSSRINRSRAQNPEPLFLCVALSWPTCTIPVEAWLQCRGLTSTQKKCRGLPPRSSGGGGDVVVAGGSGGRWWWPRGGRWCHRSGGPVVVVVATWRWSRRGHRGWLPPVGGHRHRGCHLVVVVAAGGGGHVVVIEVATWWWSSWLPPCGGGGGGHVVVTWWWWSRRGRWLPPLQVTGGLGQGPGSL